MSFLPKLRNTSAPSRVEEVAFLGLDRTEGAKGGYFSDTQNMVSVDFPFISSRNSRYLSKLPEGMSVLGVYSAKELCFVLGDGRKSYFYYGGVIKGEWEDAAQKEKFFCEVGGAIYIYPDRKMYRMKNEKAIEDYISSHPRVGTMGEGYIYFNFNAGAGYTPRNRNTFGIRSLTHEFDAGDAINFYAFERDTGKRVPLYNLPKGVVMSGKKSFENVYVYDNNFNAKGAYQTDNNLTSYTYIKVEYEFTYPAAFDEEFIDFSNRVISNEVYKDEEGNQYLVIHKSLKQFEAASSEPQKEFLEYNFQPGMTVFFDFTDEALREVLPESAVLLDMGVDSFYHKNNYINAAYLKFAPDTFNIDEDWISVTSGNVKKYVILKNSAGDNVYITSYAKYPALQGVTCVNNRLWGYENNTIYASALGKPYIMGAYKGLSTDSWAVETGIKRDFTGVIEYGSIPHFFTEDRIIKVYGDAPSSFRTAETICSGVKNGSEKSLCICAGVLYYLDKDGLIAAYSGSYPSVISRKLNEEFESGIFVCDERFLYCILGGKTSGRGLYTFDVLNKIWFIESDKEFSDAVYSGGNVYLFRDGFIECTGDIDLGFEKYNEAAFQSLLEFPVNDEGIFNQKKLKKVLLKINAEAGTELCVEVRETESAEYARVFERVINEGDGVIVVPISCLRTLGYSIRIKARGKWRLEGIMRRVAIGSYKA